MTNIEEKDVESEVGRDFTNFRIRTKVLSSCSGAGAGVNAFATADPLSELVWSPHSGLGLKCANGDGGADVRKPFLLWNVAGDAPLHHTIVDPTHSEGSGKFEEENCMVDTHHQTIQTDESRKQIAEASPGVVPAENESKEKGLPGEGSGICLYPEKGKGKALSDGDIYGRSSDDEDDSSNSVGHSPKGVKRKVWDESAIVGSKRMRSAFVMKPDSSFLKWISNMTTTKDDSLSPLPLACQENFKPRAATGFRAMFQSLFCRETDESSVGGKKIVETVEVSREVAVDDENVDALGEETKITSPGRSSNGRTSLWITRLSTKTLRSEKGKEMGEESIDRERCKKVFSGDVGELSAFRVEESYSGGERLDAIRNLRLTRADILRWMNSEVPLSHLKGYFVRVRLGNEEAGSYYVGRITGTEKKKKGMMIWVEVGGIKSCVATQYVSNHEFEEDEIKAWWSRTCKIPSLAHLNSKFNHRQTFGF